MLKLTIAQKKTVTNRISEFILAPENGGALPAYSPGAHINVTTSSGPRSYSLFSWPGEKASFYRIAVQREDEGTGGSLAMHALSEGQTLDASLPTNDFVLEDEDKPVALLAGGIGVTPLIAMATHLQDSDRPFAFHYTGRSEAETAYVDTLREVFGDKVISYFDDAAPLDFADLMKTLRGHAIYICGPKGMIDAARAAAEAVDIAASNIHVELFTNNQSSGADEAFEVEIASTGQVISVSSSETIIDALEAAGLDPLYDCQRGDCGICQTTVISGTPDHRDVVLSQAERDAGNVMQICVSRALSARLVLDL